MVKPEHSTDEPFPAAYWPVTGLFAGRLWKEDVVTLPLVVSFRVMVGHILAASPPERGFAEEDHLVQALGFYGGQSLTTSWSFLWCARPSLARSI